MNVIINLKIVTCLFLGINVYVTHAQKLSPYESFEHINPQLYVNHNSRAFDSCGIITEKKEYHALTIADFGIINYDAFKATGDSSYYRHAINQFNYFKDTSKLIFTDKGMCIGLPYRYNYKGLKAPWFSGMTQGVAASYLLRYYELTGDEYALELSEKIIRFMLKPESEGGTIGRSKEGGPWIEEYPTYQSSKSVLNGFINGLIGLKEYSDFFPRDEYAKIMHDSCYREMIEHIHLFDTPAWTTYSRNGNAISNAYMRYELEEFDHLYSIYEDERLRRQMKIWAHFAEGKYDKNHKFLIHLEYDFSKEIKYDPVRSGFVNDCSAKFYSGLKEIAILNDSENKYVEIPQKTNYLQIKLKNGEKPKKIQVKAFASNKQIALQITENDSAFVIESVESLDKLQLKLKKHKLSDACIRIYDYKSCVLPQFSWFTPCTPKYISKGQKIQVSGNMEHLTNGVVFYRIAANSTDLKKQLFRQSNYFPLNGEGIIAQETGEYEFFVSYDITHPVSSLSGFEIRISD